MYIYTAHWQHAFTGLVHAWTVGCSVLPQSWNFASKLGEPMRIGMIGPQNKKQIDRPINDRIPAIFVSMGISMGKWPDFGNHVGK